MATDRIKWSIYRLLFLFSLCFCLFTGIGAFLIAPLMSYYFFRDLKFWRYFSYYPALMKYSYRLTYIFLFDNTYQFHRTLPLTAPPMSGPDRKKVKVSNQWNNGEHLCNGCSHSHCCRRIECPLFDGKSGNCRSYDSFYWRYFNCGRFPVDQQHIDLYHCPKWEMI